MMERVKRVVSLVLCLVMVFGLLPMSAFAVSTDDTLTAALAEAKSYINGLTVNNSSNDPATVVKNFKTHFTWDNEKRENSASYLYDWSYYNGVVFEGIEYLYEVTGDTTYKDYVVEYMSSLIADGGKWATCSNNSSKQCAGYNASHGADCYKTASLLLDAYEMTGDNRYLTMAKTLYADLDSAASKYSLKNAGNNYRHTWASDPSPDLWLDGLYMILPFRAEYAKYIGDQEELDLIVSRMQWVSDNMYNKSNGLFYHAADSATSNSGNHWLRAIGWYAAAIVDIMDSMEGSNLEAMKVQLKKLVDGMKACQNSSNGMWLNNMKASQSSTNPYETSGTALVCYAVMKAVNNGWLDESYADMAILAFKGICNEKLSGSTLKDICFKGAPGSSNSTFYDNEGKGVGPFIMLTAEIQEYVNKPEEEPEPTEPEITEPEVSEPEATEPVKEDVDVTVGEETVTVTVQNVTNVVTGEVTADDQAVVDAAELEDVLLFDMTAEFVGESTKAIISVPVPEGWDRNRIVGVSVEEGELKLIPGSVDGDVFSFEVEHFSAKGVALAAETDVLSGSSALVGGTVYQLNEDGVIDTTKTYLIVNTGSDTTSGHALTNNSGTAGDTTVTVSNGSITVEDDSDIAWTLGGRSSGSVGNNGRYVYPNNGSLTLNQNGSNLTISDLGDGEYRIYRYSSNYYYYLTYSSGYYGNGSWTGARTRQQNSVGSVYLYEWASSSDGDTVTFTINPSLATIAPDGTVDLNGTVTVGGMTVDLDDCTITYTSGNANVLTVSDEGIVTGVADGTAVVKAVLSDVDNTALTESIELRVTITVQSKQLDSSFTPVLKGNNPVVTDQGVEPDFSNITLEVKFEGDDNNTIITVENGLEITDYNKDEIGFYYATISYMGVEYGTVRVTVKGNPYAGKEEATVYPEYPADGAVRIDKTAKELDFATTGLVEVELDVAGVSVKQGVDVVLVVDVSNSMGWSLENAGASKDADRIADAGQINKLEIAMNAATDFADVLLKDNSGSTLDNTLSFVTFAGYDSTFGKDANDSSVVDSLMEVFQRETSFEKAKDSFEGTTFEVGISSYHLTITDNNNNVLVDGSNRGDTNYDYAFWQATQTANAIKAYNTDHGQGNRDVYIVFMTDGAPSHYNHNNKQGTGGRDDRVPSNIETSYKVANDYDTNQTTWYNYFSSNANIYAKELYTAVDGNIIAVGFDLDHGGFTVSGTMWQWTQDQLVASLSQVAHDDELIEVHATSSASELQEIYNSLARKIKYAGTQAEATDVIDSDFTLQMSDTTGTAGLGIGTADVSSYNPSINIKLYDLWTKDETTDTTLIGTRQKDADGNLIVDVIETVEFNADGTEATSNLKEGNILSTEADGTVIIDAYYFTYTKTPAGVESFDWRIGNITDKEIALSFMAYLKGSLEGQEANGLKYTNEEATLEYIDINDKHATQIFPVPAVAWGGASTAYEFYLVNDAGKPCDRNGNEIPFANRIIITGPFYQDLYLNQGEEEIAKEIVALKVLPAGYTLYDETAKYTVQTASGNNEGYLNVSTPASGKAQTTIVVDYVEKSYIQSRVAFGVMYNQIPTESEFVIAPDRVVIDYGKSININVNANNTDIPEGVTATLIGFSKYYDNVDVTQQFSNTPYSAPFEGNYGTFTLNADGTVNYQPHKMVDGIGQVFCVYRLTKGTDTYYMVSRLDVIPATVMYYETDFADWFESVEANKVGQKVFTMTGFGADKTDGTKADDPQDMSNIGAAGHIYGYDSSYENDYMLSNGRSEFAEGKADLNQTTVTFSFTGTGFDVISRTGAAQGLIKVEVFTDATMNNRVRNVSVLNKSESNLDLYQIPVVSVHELPHRAYYVKISVYGAYDHATIEELDRGAEFYFDAIRVYDPAQGNAIAETAYNDDGEANEQIVEVRELLITAKTFEAIASGSSTAGAVFVDSTYQEDGNADHVSGNVGVTDYAAIGPNNELYLTNGQAVAFKFKANNVPATFDIGAKTINGVQGQTATLNVTVRNAAGNKSWSVTKTIGSSTVQFVDLFNATGVDKSMIFGDDTYIVITNTGSGILSITDIKAAYSVNTAEVLPTGSGDGNDATVNGSAYDPYAVFYSVDAQTLSVARSVLLAQNGATVEPEQPEVDAAALKIVKASAKNNGNSGYNVSVVTSLEVKDVLVLQGSVELETAEISYVDNADGTRTWTIVVSNGVSSRYGFFTLIGVGEGGVQGAAFNVAKSR